MNTDTPETDGIVEQYYRQINVPTNPIPADFARKLERERDELRDQRTKAVEKYQSAVKEMHEAGMHRDRLAEALNAILNDDPDSPLYKIKEAQDALAAWKEARGES